MRGGGNVNVIEEHSATKREHTVFCPPGVHTAVIIEGVDDTRRLKFGDLKHWSTK